MVHESHVIVTSGTAEVQECLRCFACTCHYANYLAVPCKAFDRNKRKKVVSNAA